MIPATSHQIKVPKPGLEGWHLSLNREHWTSQVKGSLRTQMGSGSDEAVREPARRTAQLLERSDECALES